MSDEPRVEIRLPPITEETSVENIVAVHAVRDALAGEEVIWPPEADDAWAVLEGWANQIPGSSIAYTATATALMFTCGGKIIRMRKEREERR